MSFLDGERAVRDGRPVFLAAGCRLPLPPEQAGDGRPVTLGIRPAHVGIGERADRAALAAEVVAIEPLGAAWLVTLRRDGWQLTSRLDEPPRFAEGQTITVNLDMRQAYWFDRRSGVSLGRTVPAG
jgi:multiple sugar transport system ATP-binding protein